jgi:hypothetical protein
MRRAAEASERSARTCREPVEGVVECDERPLGGRRVAQGLLDQPLGVVGVLLQPLPDVLERAFHPPGERERVDPAQVGAHLLQVQVDMTLYVVDAAPGAHAAADQQCVIDVGAQRVVHHVGVLVSPLGLADQTDRAVGLVHLVQAGHGRLRDDQGQGDAEQADGQQSRAEPDATRLHRRPRSRSWSQATREAASARPSAVKRTPSEVSAERICSGRARWCSWP